MTKPSTPTRLSTALAAAGVSLCMTVHAQPSLVAATAQTPNSTTGSVPAGNGIGYDGYLHMAQATPSTAAGASEPASAYARTDGYSLLPYTRRGYVGINLGQADFKNGCGAGGFACDRPDASVSLYTGGLFNDWFGMELGYMNTGSASRAGGRTRAQGVNLSLLARAPLGAFNVFAKGGAIYAQTKVSADPLSGVSAGARRGWGGTYGAGMGFDFTPASGVVLEWNRSQLRFPGNGAREDVDTTSLGYIYRF